TAPFVRQDGPHRVIAGRSLAVTAQHPLANGTELPERATRAAVRHPDSRFEAFDAERAEPVVEREHRRGNEQAGAPPAGVQRESPFGRPESRSHGPHLNDAHRTW